MSLSAPTPAPAQTNRFQLFGFGPRRKFVYQSGVLRDALYGEIEASWEVREAQFDPAAYRVIIDTAGSERVKLVEDEEALWIEERGERRALTSGHVKLPDFGAHAQARLPRSPVLTCATLI